MMATATKREDGGNDGDVGDFVIDEEPHNNIVDDITDGAAPPASIAADMPILGGIVDTDNSSSGSSNNKAKENVATAVASPSSSSPSPSSRPFQQQLEQPRRSPTAPVNQQQLDDTSDKINKAVSFLSNPTVRDVSNADKRLYLKRNANMSAKEIDAAMMMMMERPGDNDDGGGSGRSRDSDNIGGKHGTAVVADTTAAAGEKSSEKLASSPTPPQQYQQQQYQSQPLIDQRQQHEQWQQPRGDRHNDHSWRDNHGINDYNDYRGERPMMSDPRQQQYPPPPSPLPQGNYNYHDNDWQRIRNDGSYFSNNDLHPQQHHPNYPHHHQQHGLDGEGGVGGVTRGGEMHPPLLSFLPLLRHHSIYSPGQEAYRWVYLVLQHGVG